MIRIEKIGKLPMAILKYGLLLVCIAYYGVFLYAYNIVSSGELLYYHRIVLMLQHVSMTFLIIVGAAVLSDLHIKGY